MSAPALNPFILLPKMSSSLLCPRAPPLLVTQQLGSNNHPFLMPLAGQPRCALSTPFPSPIWKVRRISPKFEFFWSISSQNFSSIRKGLWFCVSLMQRRILKIMKALTIYFIPFCKWCFENVCHERCVNMGQQMWGTPEEFWLERPTPDLGHFCSPLPNHTSKHSF